jgi:hypothetical protein
MSKRRQGSANESLAEALSRVMVTRSEHENHHLENYDWATVEGRGDRMPRFLERAIQDVPHAQRHVRRSPDNVRYQGRSRLFARATFLMSTVAVLTGVGISFVDPARVAPIMDEAKRWARTATVSLAGMTFTSSANAATPRLGFGEALRNYSQQAAALEARAPIVVSNLVPGTVLSAGEPVTETSWSLPQSDFDNLVITFPTNASNADMRATVEIPGNTSSSSGKFSVELRQANEAPAAEATATDNAAPAAAVDAEPERELKPTVKAKSADEPKFKRKPKPTAALAPAKQRSATPKVAAAVSSAKAAAAAAAAAANPNAASTASVESNASSESSGPSFLSFLPSLPSASPNALTMFSLGGPALD